MLKLLKNLKYSIGSVIIIIILLCLQAWADLTLPDYTSKIVNVGIQAGGIESAIPEIISKNDMETILLLTDKDDQILEKYRKNGSVLTVNEQNTIKHFYGDNHNVDAESIYFLNELSEEEEENFTKLMSSPLVMYSSLTSAETEGKIKEAIMANIPEEQKTVIVNMSLIDIIKNMPEEQLAPMLSQYSEKVSQMSDSIKEQAAITSVKQLYKNLNIDTDKLQNDYIFNTGLQMLGVALISIVSAILIMYFSSKVAAALGRTLREKVFNKVTSFSSKELREFSTASLITRSTNDIQQIQQLIVMLFRVAIYAPIIGIGGIFKVINNTDNSMAWIIGIAMLAIFFVIGTLFIIAMPKFKKLQDLIDRLNLVSREILTGLPVIRAFNNEEKEEKRFDIANLDLMKTNMFVNKLMSMMLPCLMLIMHVMTVLVIWVGGQGVDQGLLQVGDMMAFMQYMMQILIAFLFISILSIILPRASVSAKRINEVLETDPNVQDKEETKKFDKNKKGLVEFKNVSFRYPDADEEILSDISFTAKPGETTAIIGSTGSGKSTVVNLIPRFYDVTEGELCVDGVNIKDVSQKDLRDIIGFVPQKGILFSGTIESNIKYSNDKMSNTKMKEAAEIAQASEFIESKEKKYKDSISQGGSNVSGGQRQRLSIARAIAKEPEIFVFDDSFSALDFKTDATLRAALEEKTENKTVIIVAQRINTVLNANQIIVLEEGKIVGIGTHEELLKNNETYRQIALSQLSEEELSQDIKNLVVKNDFAKEQEKAEIVKNKEEDKDKNQKEKTNSKNTKNKKKNNKKVGENNARSNGKGKKRGKTKKL